MTDPTSSTGGSARSDLWRNAARSASTRLIVLALSAVLGILITRLIIQNFGQAAFAQYGLLVAMAALIPFADLGISGAIMNAIGSSEDPRHDDHVRRTLVTSIRTAVSAAVVVVAIAVLLTASGLWPAILGEALAPGSGPLAAGLCLALIGLCIPFGVGQRVITALGKNHISIALNGLQSPLVLGALLLVVWLGSTNGFLLPVIPYTATLIIVGLSTLVALRLLGPAFPTAIRQARHRRSVRGARVFDMAWPLMVQMIALPLAMQTDRIVLSHVSDTADLAQYNLASQLYTPVYALVAAAGFTLWPVFAKARSRGQDVSPVPVSLGFAGIAASLCVVLTLMSPLLVGWASGGQISLDPLLLASFSVLMTLQAMKYPLGMYLTEPRGMRYQALMVVAMIPVNLGLSIVLATRIGAAGPVIGSAVGVLLFQVVAYLAFIRRRRVSEPIPEAAVAR